MDAEFYLLHVRLQLDPFSIYCCSQGGDGGRGGEAALRRRLLHTFQKLTKHPTKNQINAKKKHKDTRGEQKQKKTLNRVNMIVAAYEIFVGMFVPKFQAF